MGKGMDRKKTKKTEAVKIIENDYLKENLNIELEKLGIALLYVDLRMLKNIGAKIEVIIYKEDGICHKNCSATTRIIKSIINEKHDNADEYGITVSSPGFKWLFRGEKEFEVFKNAPIKIVYNKKSSEIIKAKTVTGILLGSDDNSIEIENERENITISRDAIEKIYLNY